jgi:serine protease Do
MRSGISGGAVDIGLAEVAERLRRSTVQVHARGGHGSGLIASAGGVVVTNAHVARGKRIDVVLADGSGHRSRLLSSAPDRDLALLQVDAPDLVPVAFRDSRTLHPGELVVAVGNPLDLVGAVAFGIVHAMDPRGRRVVTDIRLLPGNSGGPLADAAGSVIGVNAMVIDGLAVAISANVVTRFLAAREARPYIGVVTTPVRIEVMGEARLGLLVVEQEDGGPAIRAGVLSGDVVIGLDGVLIATPSDMADALESASPEDSLRLDIVRAGVVTGVTVRVGDRARAPDAAA